MANEENRESALEKWEKAKTQGQPFAEHILNVIKAGLSAAPFAGAIASLMTDYIPTARSRRLEEFAEHVGEDLNRLQHRVKSEYLRTDDFAYMFERCFRAVAENPQREKLEAFRGILVNSAIRQDVGEEEKEFFLNVAMNLSTVHIRVLRFMATPEEYLQAAGIPSAGIQGGFSTFFPVALPGIQLDVIKSAFTDLHNYGLINTDQSIFGTMTSGQGLQLLRGRVTQLGSSFVSFCTVPG